MSGSAADYGVFAQIVAIGGSLAAAAGAFTLGFVKRSRWQPPRETVPDGTSRLSSLITIVFVGLIYVFGAQVGQIALGSLAAVLVVAAVWALTVTITTNIGYAYHYPEPKTEANRVLGGDELTPEAEAIRAKRKNRSIEDLLIDAHGQKDLVWTRPSQARIAVRSTLGYIALIAAGACAIAAVSMLVAIAIGKP